MPFRIQRVPRGLSNVLSIFGGGQPTELEDRLRGVLDTLQFYGQTQLQTVTNSNAALAQNGFVSVVPSASSFAVLFAVGCTIVYTGAEVTQWSLSIGATNEASPIFSKELPAAGGAYTKTDGILLPYPRIILPGTSINFRLDLLAGAATLNCGLRASFGLLG